MVGFSQQYLLRRMMMESHKMACEARTTIKTRGKLILTALKWCSWLTLSSEVKQNRSRKKKHIYFRLSVFALMSGRCRSGWWNFPIWSTVSFPLGSNQKERFHFKDNDEPHKEGSVVGERLWQDENRTMQRQHPAPCVCIRGKASNKKCS